MVDGGQRLPRLERLASALELSDFEKNVVVAMIGQVRPQPLACVADSILPHMGADSRRMAANSRGMAADSRRMRMRMRAAAKSKRCVASGDRTPFDRTHGRRRRRRRWVAL